MEELNDRSAQGRACGNLGNTHYLLGNFTEAIVNHNEVRAGFMLQNFMCVIYVFVFLNIRIRIFT